MDLTLGISNYRGIYFAGDVGGQKQAAYAYRETSGGEITCMTGDAEQVMESFKQDKKQEQTQSDSSEYKDVFLPAALGILLVILVAFLGGQISYTLGMLVFVVAAYFPVEALIVIIRHSRGDTPKLHQYRRNHGAEHTVVNYWRKHRSKTPTPWTVDDICGFKYIDPECGTIWYATLFIFGAVLGVTIAFGPWWGLIQSLEVLGAALILLLVNNFLNPVNPLTLIQRLEVAKPTAYELETALAAYNALSALDETTPAEEIQLKYFS